MPNPAGARWNDGATFWNDGSKWGPAASGAAPGLLTPATPIPTHTHTAMEYWEITKARAQETLPVWTQHTPALKVNGRGAAELNTLIDGFEQLAQQRTLAQDDYDAAFRTGQDALLRMKVLGTKVPAIIEGHLEENEAIIRDVDDLYATNPRTESSILTRLRELLPVWERANAALAAQSPAQPPITRTVGGVAYTVALARALLDGYTGVVNAISMKAEALDEKRAALRAHDRTVDQLNKRWYKIAKAQSDPDSALYDALAGITTEPGTPAPETIEINNVTQGGEAGLQVLVSYVPGGGAHATTKLVKWQIEGQDTGFPHSTPLDASGNALGPFAKNQVVKVLTEVSNSTGTRTTAARTITIGEPVG